MVFQCINIRQVLWEVLKTAASGLGFQHLPRDLVNVNVWKTMLDPYSKGPSDTLHMHLHIEFAYFALIFFLFLHKNVSCGYWLEVPRWGTCNVYHIFVDTLWCAIYSEYALLQNILSQCFHIFR